MKWSMWNASHSRTWRAAGSFLVTSISSGSLIQSAIFRGHGAPLRVCGAQSSKTNEMWLSDCSWDYKGLGWGRAEGGPSLDINYSHCQISPSSKGCEGHRGGARSLQVQWMLILCGPVASHTGAAGVIITTSLITARKTCQFVTLWLNFIFLSVAVFPLHVEIHKT